MKRLSLFQRKNDPQAGPPVSKEPAYKIWMPKPELQPPPRPPEKKEPWSSSRLPENSIRPPRPPSTTHKIQRHAAPPAAPSSTLTQSQRVAYAYKSTPRDVATPPSANNATSSPRPSVRAANVAKTYTSPIMNGIYSSTSTSAAAAAVAPARPEMAKASSSYFRREEKRDKIDREWPRERDSDRTREKERKERDRDRDRPRDRDRDKDRDRDRDRDREQERYREREREKDRDRDRDRVRIRSEYPDPAQVMPERDRQRDTESILRVSSRDKDRTRHRERELPRAGDEPLLLYDRSREKPSSKDVDRHRESSRKHSDGEKERRSDAERHRRRAERERDREPAVTFPKPIKESSDEGESSDASKKYGMSSSHRRTKKDSTPTSTWTSHPPSSKYNHDSSIYGGLGTTAPSRSHPAVPRSGYLTSASRLYSDSVPHAGYAAPLVPKTIHDPSPFLGQSTQDQRLFSPDPLPIPLRIPEGHPLRDTTATELPVDSAHNVLNNDGKVSKRSDRYGTSTSKTREVEQNVSNASHIPPTTSYPISIAEADTYAAEPFMPSNSLYAPPLSLPTDRPASQLMNQVPGTMAYAQHAKPTIVEPNSSNTLETRPSASRSEYPSSASRQKHSEHAPSAVREGRLHKGSSSASQQAAHATTVTHGGRRDRDKRSKQTNNKENRRQDTNNVLQTNHDSLLYQGAQMANPPVPTTNNSPHPSISIRLTPPTPMQRSPSMLDERPVVVNHSNQSGLDALAPPRFAATPKPVSREYIPSPHSVQFSRELWQDANKANETSRPKVAQIVTGYETRSSPTKEKSMLDSTFDPPSQTMSAKKVVTPVNTFQVAVNVAPSPSTQVNSSPSFNVAVSTNERGRTVSISASNDGSPYKIPNTGFNSGPHLNTPLSLDASDTPSSKHSIQVPFTPASQYTMLANSSPNHSMPANGYMVQPNIGGSRAQEHGKSRFTARSHPVAHDPVTSAIPTLSGPGTTDAAAITSQVPINTKPVDELKDRYSRKKSRSGKVSDPSPWSTHNSRQRNDFPISMHSESNDRNIAQSPTETMNLGPSHPVQLNPAIPAPPVGGLLSISHAQSGTSHPSVRQHSLNTDGSTVIPQARSYPGTFTAGDTSAQVDAVPRTNLTSFQGEPVERPSSTTPFRHPKLAELLSDTASLTKAHAPEPVILPLAADFPMMVPPPSSVKQDEWMLPSPSKLRDGPSPATAEGYSNLVPSSLYAPRTHTGHSRKNSGASLVFDTHSSVQPENAYTSASKPQSSTVVNVVLSQGDITKPSGGKNDSFPSHVNSNSQPEQYAAPPRPPSTRPIHTADSNAPYQSSTYNLSNHRGRIRSKLPETNGFESPAQPPYMEPPSSSNMFPAPPVNLSLSTQTGDQARPVMTPRPSQDSILLKTPSSLAHSVLKPTISRTSSSSQQDSRKKGFFGMFKSRNSGSQETAGEQPYEVWTPSGSQDDHDKSRISTEGRPADMKPSFSKSLFKSRTPSSQAQPIKTDNLYEVWTPPTIPVQAKYSTQIKSSSDSKPAISRTKIPPPITVPIAIPITERKSPNHKVFTPFRYLNSKRNRTVSAASVEAVDGTAPNTVVGSPTASMNSSQPPIQIPPTRDTQQATHEWRERKESETLYNKHRVQRPGVVFDVPQDPHQDKQNLRYAKTRSARTSAR